MTRSLQGVGFVVAVVAEPDLSTALNSFRPHLLVLDGPLNRAKDNVTTLGVSPSMVVLIGLSDPCDRAQALLAGFGDATSVPAHPDELMARVSGVVRRTVGSVVPPGLLRAGAVTLDELGHRANAGGEWVDLTSLEVRLLAFLLRHPGIPHRRETLLQEVWGYSVGDLTTVTVHIRRLRSKIEPDPSAPVLITTVWGVGYRFDPMDS